MKLEDFEGESAKAVRTINAWIEEQTNKLIHDLLSANDVTRDTQLIIVNCIYFKVDTISYENDRVHGSRNFIHTRPMRMLIFMGQTEELRRPN